MDWAQRADWIHRFDGGYGVRRRVTKLWGFLPLRCRRLPRRYVDRGDQRSVWQELFTAEEMIHVDAMLRVVCQSFLLSEDDRYHFSPSDTVADVYRSLYPRWRFWRIGDMMELETLFLSLEHDFGVDVSRLHAGIELSELVAILCGHSMKDHSDCSGE